jgi:hypothetical protein
MFGFFKRMPQIDISDSKSNEDSKPGKDRAFIIVISFFAAIVIITLVKATYDPETAQQLKNLKIGTADKMLFLATVIGYYTIRRRGKK